MEIKMGYLEIAAEVKQLPVDERLLLLEELTRSLRLELVRPGTQLHRGASSLWRGMLKPDGPPPLDQEIKDSYAEYLIEKYR
jgi:hypothetical protein